MFFLIFAILGVTYFKGILMSCQGDGFDALPQAVVSFIESPVSWSEMSDQQREWFGPSSNVSEAYEVEFASQCAVINSGWPDSAACCPDWPLSSSEAPTSFQVFVCMWFCTPFGCFGISTSLLYRRHRHRAFLKPQNSHAHPFRDKRQSFYSILSFKISSYPTWWCMNFLMVLLPLPHRA